MAPTPTPNKRPTAAVSPTLATSVTRTPPSSRRKPPRSLASQRAHGDTGGVTTSNKRAMERLVDELSNPPLPSAGDREEAFESARKKFAMYGKQNAHVSHYSPDQQQALLLQQNRRRALKRQAPTARRVVDWDDNDSSSSTGNAAVLQNTVLLQENGELAAQLDDMEYHLDGILDTPIGSETEDRGFARASSVVALTKLLQLEQVQTVMKVASQSQLLNARLRDVLLRLKTLDHRVLKLSVATMAYLLTVNADADEFFSDDVIDGVIAALESECRRLDGDVRDAEARQDIGGDGVQEATATVETKTPLKKSFLKRKKNTGGQRVVLAGEDDVFAHGNDEGNKPTKLERTRATAQREEVLRADLRKLLRGHDVFMVDGQIQLSTADLLCMLLHNILQVGGASGGDSSESSGHGRKEQSARHFHQRQDLAGTTFETIMKRKKLLIRNGGLALLLKVLEKRFNRLHEDLGTDLLRASVSLDLACAFQRVRTMLRVLDQASFLATEVQLQMSKDEMIFRVVLTLVETLSNLAWSFKSRRKWQSDPTFMQLIVDVLMSAMRVLINLSHQNEDANTHIAKLEGTKILFLAFCKLWGTVEQEQAMDFRGDTGPSQRITEERTVYDALLLMLSAITNCVEYSPDNRAQLSKLDLSTTTLDGLEAFRSSSACSLLVSFFVGKVQSYIHLFEMSDSQRGMEEEAWVPEDVVLGGCTSLLLGCLMKDSSYNSAIILGALPDASPRLLLRALSAFVALHSQIGALTPEVGKSVLEVEKLLKSFSFVGSDASPQTVRPSSASIAVARRPSDSEGQRMKTTEITFMMKATPHRGRMFEVEEVKTDGREDKERQSQRSTDFQQALRSPPASAFKLQRFSRVCSNVDDSDIGSDVDPSPVKKPRVASTPKSPSRSPPPKSPSRSPPQRSPSRSPPQRSPSRSPARARVTVNATVTLTPIRRVSDSAVTSFGGDLEGQGSKLSIQRRLKRTRQLVSDLEAEFMKIGSRVSSETSAAAEMTSTEDGEDKVRNSLSQHLFSNQETVQETPQKPKKMSKPNDSVKTPNANQSIRKQVQTPTVSKKQLQTPATTHKRKAKATPAKSTNKRGATKNSDDVFDFLG